LILSKDRLFIAFRGFSAFKRAAALLPRSGTGRTKCDGPDFLHQLCFSVILATLAVTGLGLKPRLSPRNDTGEGEAFKGGDDSSLLTGF